MSQTRGSLNPVDGLDVPPATRATRPGWRDPRLWVGVAIVAASVLLGAKVIGDADDSVAVWTVTADLGPGDEVGAEDVVARRVRFVQASDADRYLSADEPLPADARVTRDVGAGELLPRSALGTQGDATLQTMTFRFEGAGVPDGLAQGDRVDVFVTTAGPDASAAGPGEPAGVGGRRSSPPRSTPVLRDLVVTGLTGADAGFAGGTTRSVTVGVPADTRADGLAAAVQAAKTDNVFLVKQG